MKENICPICETGSLVARTYDGQVLHKDLPIVVHGMEFSECQSCGADPVLADQARRNQSRIADAKRAYEKLLSAGKIKQAREYLGLTQHQASLIFGGGLNAFSKYERGEVIQSEAMDKLIRVACEFRAAWLFLKSFSESDEDRPLILSSRAAHIIRSSRESFSFTPEAKAVLGNFKVVNEKNEWKDQGALDKAA